MKTIYLTLGILIMLTLNSCTPTTPAYTGMPRQIISIQQAAEMKNEYKSKIIPRIEKDRPDYQATEFTWISLDTLKQYVALLDKVKELNGKEISGVRIYFAAYPNSPSFKTVEGKKVKYPDRETLFIVPTTPVVSSETSKLYKSLENLPFCIQPSGNDPLKGDYKIIGELLYPADNGSEELKSNNIAARGTEEATSLIMNDMQMVPPPKK